MSVQDKLAASMELLVTVLMERLEDKTITAAEMTVLRQLLKDNNVSIDRTEGKGIAETIREVMNGLELQDIQ